MKAAGGVFQPTEPKGINGMLVLGRRKEGRIYIGDDICITVVEVRGEAVKLGIDAPREVPIWRDDIIKKLTPATDRIASDSREQHEA